MASKPNLRRLSVSWMPQTRRLELCFIVLVVLGLNTFIISLIVYLLGCGDKLLYDESSIRWIQDPNLRAYFGHKRVPIYRIIQVKPEKEWEDKFFDIYDISTEDISKEAQFYMDVFEALKSSLNSSDYFNLQSMTEHDSKFMIAYRQSFYHANLTTGDLVTKDETLDKRDMDDILLNINLPKTSLLNSKEPISFLPKLRNSCWKSPILDDLENLYNGSPYLNQAQKEYLQMERDTLLESGIKTYLRCIPYFYILGVTESGTEDLYSKLSSHPDIVPPQVGNSYYWKLGRLGIPDAKPKTSFNQYVDLFDELGIKIQEENKARGSSHMESEKITLEASPNYASDPTSLGMIPGNKMWLKNGTEEARRNQEPRFIIAHTLQAINPSAKYIFMLRNPTSRLYQHYRADDKRTNTTRFHKEVVYTIQGYTKCLKMRTIRSCFYRQNLGKMGKIFAASMYYVFINDWINVIPRDQFMFIKTEDYEADPRRTLSETLKFLELELDNMMMENLPNLEQDDDKNLVKQDSDYPDMQPRTRELLDSFFSPYNEMLAKLLADSKWLWMVE